MIPVLSAALIANLAFQRCGPWEAQCAVAAEQPSVEASLIVPAPTELTGTASWYGPGFHGRLTAGGEIYDQEELTAAHRTLPLGTPVKVTNLQNGRSVRVRITDRGPYVDGRILDLSRAAARALDMLEDGIARVRVELLTR